ncbi:MAG TPA: hypothetical protein VFJ21_14015 [Mycobacteriales bacterium]|jgi:hypothetical protein|nr:hypothetical protein [Mycobacteriales bacterium]
MADRIVVLRGGARDGNTLTVAPEVTRVIVASEAPGLVDIYEDTGEQTQVRGNDQPGVVYDFVGQEAASDEHLQVLRRPMTGRPQ